MSDNLLKMRKSSSTLALALEKPPTASTVRRQLNTMGLKGCTAGEKLRKFKLEHTVYYRLMESLEHRWSDVLRTDECKFVIGIPWTVRNRSF